MANQLYICRQCGCPDLVMPKGSLILEAKDCVVACPNCKWEGPLTEAAGIYTKEKVFDLKSVMNLLLHVTTKHASGPLIQAFEFIGLLEKDDIEGRNKVMRAALEGLIRDSFVAASEHAESKGVPVAPVGDVGEAKDKISDEEQEKLS